MMDRRTADRMTLAAAGVVIVGLTAAAFWLSYAHLASVAQAHGLGASPERTWAWPATLDMFIVSGELLMLRAGIRGERDWWAIGLTAAGSVGSIGLNVAGVGAHAAFLDYLVAAVPPTAALLAFGALMRQVHGLVVGPGQADSGPVRADAPVSGPLSGGHPEVSGRALPTICGAGRVHVLRPPARVVVVGPDYRPLPLPPRPEHLEFLRVNGDYADADGNPTEADTQPDEADTEVSGDDEKIDAAHALNIIRSCWVMGVSVRKAAEQAGRKKSYVHEVYVRLNEEHKKVFGEVTERQLALVQGGGTDT
jgi:hypothetical protein